MTHAEERVKAVLVIQTLLHRFGCITLHPDLHEYQSHWHFHDYRVPYHDNLYIAGKRIRRLNIQRTVCEMRTSRVTDNTGNATG